MQSSLLPPQYREKEKLVGLIRYMGRLYDADIEGIDQFVKFQEILDLVDSNKTTGIFNMQEKLQRLSPKCNEMLIKCKWGGEYMNCSEILETRRTSEGYCCTFNYVRRTDNTMKMKEARPPAGRYAMRDQT
jgi:acid-sensing ion channel, other